MPLEVNNLRIGETIALGCNSLDRTPWPGTRQDTVRLIAEVVELERKPSAPTGETAQDAFGVLPGVVDRGVRNRAICNVGRQDVQVEGLVPEDPRIIGSARAATTWSSTSRTRRRTCRSVRRSASIPGTRRCCPPPPRTTCAKS